MGSRRGCAASLHANSVCMCVRNMSAFGPPTIGLAKTTHLRCVATIVSLQSEFFREYEKEHVAGEPMLKVKDWPPAEDFKERMVRHNQVRLSLQAEFACMYC